jgi:hypothetical protein
MKENEVKLALIEKTRGRNSSIFEISLASFQFKEIFFDNFLKIKLKNRQKFQKM